MKDKKSEAEAANIKINQILDGETDRDSVEVDPLINNNNISLVLRDQDKEDNL